MRVYCLIKNGGYPIYDVNANGETALLLASMTGHTDVVKTILHADRTGVNIVSTDGLTALMVASAQVTNSLCRLRISTYTCTY